MYEKNLPPLPIAQEQSLLIYDYSYASKAREMKKYRKDGKKSTFIVLQGSARLD